MASPDRNPTSYVPALPTFAYSEILQPTSSTLQALSEACSTYGFFYLDLREADAVSNGDIALSLIQEIFEYAPNIFDIPIEEKMQYEVDHYGDVKIGGYKPAGKHSGIVDGKRDGFENFLLPRNNVAQLSSDRKPPWPAVIASKTTLIQRSSHILHSIGLQILEALSTVLDIPQNSTQRLEKLHRADQLSTTTLAVLKYLPSDTSTLQDMDTGHMAHTDVGTLTLLFTTSPGLQILSPQDQTWISVPPLSGHAIVNVGDSLSFISGSRFTSSLHRVVPSHLLSTEQSGKMLSRDDHKACMGNEEENHSSGTRYSIAYFLRPELDVHFLDAEGRDWRSEDWHKVKYAVFRADSKEQRESSLLTGRKGFLGDWNKGIGG
ncbi:hypothetical protein MMC25_007185 [Agyrium rufum]|nr:hypothetical protein [Agyrium rufum]